MEFVIGLVFSPLFWFLAFILKVIFQFLLAQKLRHPHAWFAFLPILSGIQWFQLGQRSGWNLCWVFLPFVGIFVYLYKWFCATIRMCERAGERGSFSVLFLVPYINTIATMRLAFKTGFWVKTSGEEKLIQQVIKGLETGHSVGQLQAFATSHGINLADFETALDRAETITKNSLKLSTENYSSPVALNIGVAIAYFFGGIALFFFAFTMGVANLFGYLSASNSEELSSKAQTEIMDASGVDAAYLEQFTAIMKIESYEFPNPNNKEYVSLVGKMQKGSIEGDVVYLLDNSFSLLDTVKRGGHAFMLGKGSLSVKNQVDPALIAYVATTEATQNTNRALYDPLLIIEDQQPLSDNSNITDITAELRVSELEKSDGLYIYNQDRVLIGAAKIKTIVPLDPTIETEGGVVAPGTRVKLRVELARKNVAGAQYLTTAKDLNSFDEYLDLMNN